MQLCEGLQEAHSVGVVHRDIKPDNIVIDKKGKPRLLDFGLATMLGEEKLTKTGSTLGTIGYMSPEQIEGKKVDHRSDLFSVGIILYEMLTGRRPFGGDTEASTMNAVLNSQPEPLMRYKSGVSDELQRVVSKALIKDTGRRYQHIEELLADLRSEKEKQSGNFERIQKSKFSIIRRPEFMGLLAIVSLIVIGVGFISVFQQDSRITHFMERKQITFDGDAHLARVSPDGQQLAYVRTDGKEQQVFIRDIAGGSPIEIFSEKWILDLAWTPLSNELLIGVISDSESTTLLIPRSGGQHRRYPSAGIGGFAWSPDGERFATASSFLGTIRLIEKASGTFTSIPLGGVTDNSPRSVDWSPKGNLLIVQGDASTGTQLWTIRLRDNEQFRILDSTEARWPHWSPDGKAVYFMEPRSDKLSNMMKIQVDPETGAARSSPSLLMSGIQTSEDYSISQNGRMMVYTQDVSSSILCVIDLTGPEANQEYQQITFGTAGVRFPSPAPDGSLLAFVRNIGEYSQIFTVPISGGTPEQITFAQRQNTNPCWSSDGKYIAYVSVGQGIVRLEVVESRGGTPQIFSGIDLDPDIPGAISWSPGEKILFGGGFGYKMLDPQNGRITSLEFNDTIPRAAWRAHYLPGGKRVAVIRGQPRNHDQTQSFSPQIEIVSLDSPMSSVVLDQVFFNIIGWSLDSKWLYLIDSEDSATLVMRYNIENAKTERILTIPIKRVGDVVMLPDGSSLVCIAIESQSDIWLVENFDPDVR